MKYVTPTLGPLEAEIMGYLWERCPLTVRQWHAIIQAQREIAYTTLLTMSGRMEAKGLITRPSLGSRYNGPGLLTPSFTRAELLTQAIEKSYSCGFLSLYC